MYNKSRRHLVKELVYLIQADGFPTDGAVKMGMLIEVLMFCASPGAQGVFLVERAVQCLMNDPFLFEGAQGAIEGNAVRIGQTGFELMGRQGLLPVQEKDLKDLQSQRGFSKPVVREDGIWILDHDKRRF